MATLIQNIISPVLDFIFPPRCLLCEKPETLPDIPVCNGCFEHLPVVTLPVCPRCGAAAGGTGTCSSCVDREFLFDRARVLMMFDEKAETMVHQVKYKNKRRMAVALGRRLGKELDQEPDFTSVDALVPVPLHKKRERERGFNQSRAIAQGLGEVLHKPVVADLLERTRHTTSQTGLHLKERRQNVADAFRLNPRRVVSRLPQRVVLVDDVFTTGATMNECTRVLRAAGVEKVLVATVARA
jgi:ComF family protein